MLYKPGSHIVGLSSVRCGFQLLQDAVSTDELAGRRMEASAIGKPYGAFTSRTARFPSSVGRSCFLRSFFAEAA